MSNVQELQGEYHEFCHRKLVSVVGNCVTGLKTLSSMTREQLRDLPCRETVRFTVFWGMAEGHMYATGGGVKLTFNKEDRVIVLEACDMLHVVNWGSFGLPLLLCVSGPEFRYIR